MLKKIIMIITIVLVVALVAGAAFAVIRHLTKPEENNKGELVEGNKETSAGDVEGTLEEIMAKIYEGIPEENLPMALSNMEVNAENVEGFLGTANIAYVEAIASESMVGSIAHSVVLVRLNDAKDADAIVQAIKESVNPRKWICIEASNVVVKHKGNLVILIMSNEDLAPKLEANFDNL